jgi:hypothetical protein
MHASSFPRILSAGAPYAVLSSTPGNAKPTFRTVSKLIVLLGMGECDYPQEHHSPNSCYSFASSALAYFRLVSLGYSTPLIAQMSPPCGRKRSNITHLPSGDQTG